MLAFHVEVDAPQCVQGRLALAIVAQDIAGANGDPGGRVSAVRRRRRAGGIADVPGDGLHARHRLPQPGAVDDAHRLAAAGQRLGDGHPDGAGAEHDVVDGVHHDACVSAELNRASRRPLSTVNRDRAGGAEDGELVVDVDADTG